MSTVVRSKTSAKHGTTLQGAKRAANATVGKKLKRKVGIADTVNSIGGAITVADAKPLQSKRSSFESTYRGILRALYEGRLVPGQRLVESDLTEMFHTGRGTIREVLNRLSSAGIVSIVPNKGAIVRFFSRREVMQILNVAELLLGLALRQAAQCIREPGNADLLKRTFQVLSEHHARIDPAAFYTARESFYRSILHISGNQELPRLFPNLEVHLMRVQFRAFGGAIDSHSFEDYERMYKAILSGDPILAEIVGRHHVELAAENVARLPDRGFAREE